MEFIEGPQELVYDPSVGTMVPYFTCLVYICNPAKGGVCGIRFCTEFWCFADYK